MSKRPKSVADIPASIPIFPLAGALLLPGLQRPLQIFEPRYIDMVDDVIGQNRLIGLVQPAQEPKDDQPDAGDKLMSVGSLGYLAHFEELPDGRYVIGLEGVCRFALLDEADTPSPYRQAKISVSAYSDDFLPPRGEADVNRAQLVDMLRSYAEFADLDIDWEEIEQTSTADLVNMCCMLSPYGVAEKQALLIASSLQERAETLVALAEMEMAQADVGPTLQ